MSRCGCEASAAHVGPGCSVPVDMLGCASAASIARLHGADAAGIGRRRLPVVATRTVVAGAADRDRLARSTVAFADGLPRSERGIR